MRFNCTNCNKIYEIDPGLIQGSAVMFTCRKCGQQLVIRKSDKPEEAVIPAGRPGDRIKSFTQEISKVTKGKISALTTPHALRRENPPAWYVTAMGRRQGPLGDLALIDLLSTGKILPATYAWRKSMTEWVRIKDIPELADVLAEAIRKNPEVGARLNDKSSLSSARVRNRGDVSDIDAAIPRKDAPSGSLADDLYQGLGSGPIDPRNSTILQYEESPVDDDEQSSRDAARSPTIPQTRSVDWGEEIQDTLRHQTVKTRPFKRHDTAPINLALLRRERLNTRIALIVMISLVSLAALAAGVVIAIHFIDSGTSISGQPAAPAKSANVRRNFDSVPTQDSTIDPPPEPSKLPTVPNQPAPEPAPQPTVTGQPVHDPALPPTVPGQPASDQAVQVRAALAPPGQPPLPSVGSTVVLDSREIGADDLKAFVTSQVPAIAACRSKLIHQTDASIGLELSFVLATTGRTEKVLARAIDMDEPRLTRCVEQVVASWEFDKRSYPLNFSGTLAL